MAFRYPATGSTSADQPTGIRKDLIDQIIAATRRSTYATVAGQNLGRPADSSSLACAERAGLGGWSERPGGSRPAVRPPVTGETMAFQITEVQKALKGVNYPASNDDLADHAAGNGADRELVDALRGMDKDSFDGPNAVMKGLKGSLTGSND
jgi:hypothetical protein